MRARGSHRAPIFLWTSFGHDSGGASDSVSSSVGSCLRHGCYETCGTLTGAGCIQVVLLVPFALGLWIISTSSNLAGISRGVHASVYDVFRRISHTVYVLFAPAQFALVNLDAAFTSPSLAYSFCAMLGSTVDTFSCSALGGFWTD